MSSSSSQMPGPLIVDIEGEVLTDAERQRLLHPLVGGVILFKRNYRSPDQLTALTEAIHSLRTPSLLIAIDHEGGRVQRCRPGFTLLPAMRQLGRWWTEDRQPATRAARDIGYVLAHELRDVGVDLTFAPVLDLDWGFSSVIGDRSFHADPEAVIELAGALIAGMRDAGLRCCGKHFPGHGGVAADSHIAIPVDNRSLDEMEPDLRPYRRLSLDAVMPAHVIFPGIDSRPAGFSTVWMKYLRQDIGFSGLTFSDDLSMEGASVAGGVVERVEAAWNAGVDMLLLCNAPDKVDQVLETWVPSHDDERLARIAQFVAGKNLNPTCDTSSGSRSAGLAAIEWIAGKFGTLT